MVERVVHNEKHSPSEPAKTFRKSKNSSVQIEIQVQVEVQDQDQDQVQDRIGRSLATSGFPGDSRQR